MGSVELKANREWDRRRVGGRKREAGGYLNKCVCACVRMRACFVVYRFAFRFLTSPFVI